MGGNTSSPSRIWLTDVDCGAEETSYSHILQCAYRVIVADNTDNMCQNDDLLRVTCDGKSPFIKYALFNLYYPSIYIVHSLLGEHTQVH